MTHFYLKDKKNDFIFSDSSDSLGAASGDLDFREIGAELDNKRTH